QQFVAKTPAIGCDHVGLEENVDQALPPGRIHRGEEPHVAAACNDQRGNSELLGETNATGPSGVQPIAYDEVRLTPGQEQGPDAASNAASECPGLVEWQDFGKFPSSPQVGGPMYFTEFRFLEGRCPEALSAQCRLGMHGDRFPADLFQIGNLSCQKNARKRR